MGKTGEFPSDSGRAVAYHIEFSLNNLTDGSHTLKAYSYDSNSNEMPDSVEFTVSSGLTPTATVNPFSLFDAIFDSYIPLVLICLVVPVAIALVLLAYSKKHRKTKDKIAKFSLWW